MANQFEHLFPQNAPAQISDPGGITTDTAPAASQPAATDGSGNQFQHLFPQNKPPEIAQPTTSPDATGNSFWYDTFHPQPADLSRPQTWRDWFTKTYDPSLQDYGNAALDDVTLGTGDYIQAGYGGGNLAEIRARTARSQAALGPMGPIVNAIPWIFGGEILGPAKAGATLTRAAVEGGVAGALSSEGHDLGSDKSFDQRAWDAAKQGAESAALGVGGNLVARGVAAPFQSSINAAQGAPGRAGDTVFRDWRTRSAAGEDISPDVQQFQDASGHDMSDVLNAQKIGTGPISDAARTAGNVAARKVTTPFLGPFSWMSPKVGELGEIPVNAAINRVRNYATQKALDQVYPTVTGTPLNADTSGWTRAIQRGFIGGSMP